ncbi:MAG: LCP family protein [Cellulosilyticum sp.]|nr:LCP family protein [Cellulosilyticum sp.]
MDDQKDNHNEKYKPDYEEIQKVFSEVEDDDYYTSLEVKQEPKQKGHKKKRNIIWIIVVLVIVVIAVVGGYFWLKMNKVNKTEIAPEEIQSNQLTQEQEEVMEEYTQIAVFGVDNRTNGTYGTGNSDTIMIASVNNKTKEVKLVSVYRDTYLRVNSDGYYGKANAAYSFDGAAAGISMLNTNFDLDLNRYVSVDWYAVVEGINLLGGVQIEITEAERQKINEYIPEVEKVTGIKTDRVQNSGIVKLDGVQAMAYMRIRKLAGNDYKRTQRQRMVIQATFEQIKQSDLTTLNKMVDQIFPMVETNLSVKEILALAMHMGKYQIVSTTGFPFDKDTIVIDGIGDAVIPITLATNVSKLKGYLYGKEEEVSNEVLEISQEIISRTGLDLENSEVDTDSYTTGVNIGE